MNNEQKNSAGILAINLIEYTGEYANIVEGTQYLIPFSGQNRVTAEGIVQLFNDKYGGGSEYDLTRARIIQANSVQEAVYACDVTGRLNYSYVNINSFGCAFDADRLKHLREVIELADIDLLKNKLGSFWATTLSS